MHRTLRRAALLAVTLLPLAAAAAEGKPKVAILDAHVAGGAEASAAEGLSALVAAEVARRPALGVVSAADVRALLGYEQQKTLMGCTGGACATELGGALGATWLLSVEVSRVGSTWLLGLSLLDAARATSVSRASRRSGSLDGLVEVVPAAVDELLAALGPKGAVGATPRFDGAWEVAIDCPAVKGPPAVRGYVLRFTGLVKDGRFTATHLADDQPGALRLDGILEADGQAHLTAHGRTAAAEHSLKQSPPGTAYTYGVEAAFEARRGTGRRVEGRPCSFTFMKRD